MIKRVLKKALDALGLELRIRRHAYSSLARSLRERGLDVVLDVGANEGQFASSLRRSGYAGRIVSFEPNSACVRVLKERAKADGLWDIVHVALGQDAGRLELNVTENSVFSSLLAPTSDVQSIDSGSRVRSRETVEVQRLDSIWTSVAAPAQRAFLKIDVQGFELDVLRGAQGVLPHMDGIQLEVAFRGSYEGQGTFADLHALIDAAGFELARIDEVFRDFERGTIREIDARYWRRDRVGTP